MLCCIVCSYFILDIDLSKTVKQSKRCNDIIITFEWRDKMKKKISVLGICCRLFSLAVSMKRVILCCQTWGMLITPNSTPRHGNPHFVTPRLFVSWHSLDVSVIPPSHPKQQQKLNILNIYYHPLNFLPDGPFSQAHMSFVLRLSSFFPGSCLLFFPLSLLS